MHVMVPMAALGDGKAPVEMTLGKEGPGRLYYRVGLRYAPASLRLAAADRGFTVSRRYEAVDGTDDVTQASDGTWHVRAGARVRVRLTMLAPSRRNHVALVDPLPAGLEPLNPSLKTTGSLPPTPASDVSEGGAPGLGGRPGLGSFWWWTRTWFEHQNMRDDRVEAFTSLLWEGVWEYSYVARATTPGSFVVPPARAEEMYSPETFGRTATDRLVVE
jgi:alpha-2-macroglobulin